MAVISAAVVAAAAALAAGTFPVCPKAAAARAAAAGAPHIPTPVMVWWLAVGASVTALPLALVVPQTLCWRTGLVSGSLWAIAVTGRIEAIGILGLCIASAAAAVGVTLVGTTVNVAASASATSCAPFAVAVFVLLMLALGSLWVLEAQARLLARLSASVQQPEEPSTSEHLLPQSNPAAAHSTSSSDVRAPLLLQRQGPQQQQLLHQGIEADHCSWPLMPYVIGMGWAALSGVCAGLSPAAANALAASQPGGAHLVGSTAGGMLACTSLAVVLQRMISRKPMPPDLHVLHAAPLGAAGGVLLAISLVLGPASTAPGSQGAPPALMAVLLTSGAPVFVSGLWGVLFFGELRGPLQALFWFSALLLAGASGALVASTRLTC